MSSPGRASEKTDVSYFLLYLKLISLCLMAGAGMVNVLSEICSFFLVGEFHSLIIFNNESFLSRILAGLVVVVAAG